MGSFFIFDFYLFWLSLIRRDELFFGFKKSSTDLLLQQQQYPVSFVFFGNNYTLLTNNKLEGRIVDLFVNAIVDSKTEGCGYY